MTQAEKLEALVRKAVDGGWQQGIGVKYSRTNGGTDRVTGLVDGLEYEPTRIFNHDFARALFGENRVADRKDSLGNPVLIRGMQWHLQHAVISDNPIDYMYEAVFGDQ